MSYYVPMWEKIKELTLEETDNWINVVQPARGQGIDFRGVRVNDVDVLEALRNYKEGLEREVRLQNRSAS